MTDKIIGAGVINYQLSEYDEAVNKIIFLRKYLNECLQDKVFPHELLDRFWSINDKLRNEMG